MLAPLLKRKRVRGWGNAARRMGAEVDEETGEAKETEGNRMLEELEVMLRRFKKQSLSKYHCQIQSCYSWHNTGVSESVHENSFLETFAETN
jgi:hypothetical protein